MNDLNEKDKGRALNEQSGGLLVLCGLRPHSRGDVDVERKCKFASREMEF